MIGSRSVVGIIPARGGSKRLPNKNILPLAGKPLISWTIDAARNSRYIDRVIVSTDCEEIGRISKRYGAETPFLRPPDLSGDFSSTNAVIMHAIKALEDPALAVVVILQPTSPLRTSLDIDSSIELLEANNAAGVISVCECEHPPLWSNSLPEDRNMSDFIREEAIGKRSQDFPKQYRLNGAIYAFTRSALEAHQGIHYSGETFAFEMSRANSIDIDEEIDFLVADSLMRSRLNKG